MIKEIGLDTGIYDMNSIQKMSNNIIDNLDKSEDELSNLNFALNNEYLKFGTLNQCPTYNEFDEIQNLIKADSDQTNVMTWISVLKYAREFFNKILSI